MVCGWCCSQKSWVVKWKPWHPEWDTSQPMDCCGSLSFPALFLPLPLFQVRSGLLAEGEWKGVPGGFHLLHLTWRERTTWIELGMPGFTAVAPEDYPDLRCPQRMEIKFRLTFIIRNTQIMCSDHHVPVCVSIKDPLELVLIN